VFDSSWICEVGELVSFVQLQRRAIKLNHVLMGYYELPGRTENPLQLCVNPQSAEVRLEERLWNIGVLISPLSPLTFPAACCLNFVDKPLLITGNTSSHVISSMDLSVMPERHGADAAFSV
jgi:hypothetical protein